MKSCLHSLAKTVLFFALLATSKVQAQTYNFTTWNNGNNSVLTVAAYRSVTIDKRGNAWVGADLGGLYNFNTKDSIWKKANTYLDVTFRHLVPSNIVADSNVWATSIGKTGVQAITGGAYYINTKTEVITQYGSGIAGGLSSRYANSLALSKNGKVYVASAQSLTGTTTLQGGVYVSSTLNPPAPSSTSFTNAIPSDAGDINYYSAANRGDELWFGKAASIVRLSGAGALIGTITSSNSPLPLSASTFARAIFTDTITGNTYVGLNSGGVGVCKPDGTWKLLTSSNSAFPAGGAVNFNAISAVYGEIWVGTTAGIFVYDGISSLDSVSSFKLLTTANGLPTNSITDIAVDTARSHIWITSGSGVSRASYVPPYIKGILYNVYCKNPATTEDTLQLYENLQKKPIIANATIKLFEGAVAKDSANVNQYGVFELKKAEEGKTYTVEIKYKTDSGSITYKYLNVKNHTLMGAILIPDSLIKEIKAFKPQMARRCFKLELQFLLSLTGACRDGFDVTYYDNAYQRFFDPNGITSDHQKRVNNLADFYLACATVHSLGGTSTDLANKAIGNAFDAIESLGAFVKFGGAVKEKDKADILGDALEQAAGLLVSSVKLLKEGLISGLNFASSSLTSSPDAKSIMDKIVTCISDAADLSIDLLEKGKKGIGPKLTFDLVKKELALQIAASYYKSYCQDKHTNFVLNTGIGSFNASSNFSYDQTYNNLYSSSANSRIKYAKDTADQRKEKMEFYGKVAKVADAAAGVLDAATALSLVPGGQVAGAIAKGLAITAKIVKTSALSAAMIEGVLGCVQVAALSDTVAHTSGLARPAKRPLSPPSQLSPTTLLARKNSYNQKLVELKTIYNAVSYDSVAYFTKYKEFRLEDSLYTDEMTKTLNALWASTDSAIILVPGFKGKLGKVVDSFITTQYTLRYAYYFQNLGYIFDADKSGYIAELNNLVDSIRLLNDSAVNGITYLVGDVNTNGIGAPAYLVQDAYVLNYNYQPAVSGSFTYTFKNYGTVPQNNVSFKITPLNAGYTLTGLDSVFFATIGAGQSKQVTFSFTAPATATDSICRYTIDVKASNGSYKDVTGSLFVEDPTKVYSAKNGNWSSPSTWSNNAVPTAASNVIVSHDVIVDIDATCKSIKALLPGVVTVNTNKKLTVVH